MMLPTHAVVGLAIATPLVLWAPELAPAALTGALLGSIFPDLDLYAGHRRTLHYPTGFTLASVPAVAYALFATTPTAVAVAFAVVGAALHCRMDRYGGGLELRPWQATSDRAVYDHVRGRWREPKRWVEYDGSPGDFALTILVGVPLLFVLDRPFTWIVAVALVVGGVYTLLRRRLAVIAPIVFEYVPDRVQRYVPDRYRS